MKRINHPIGQNPNTKEFYDEFYSKKDPAKERDNTWMYPTLLDHAPKTGVVLEVGCGMGKDLAWLQEHNGGCLYFGTDISEIAVNKANKIYGEKIRFYDMSIFELGKDYADFIICSQTLEHLDNPKEAVLTMVDALRDGGKLFITVPTPNGTLARVKMHVNQFQKSDFKQWLGESADVWDIDKSHMCCVWEKK